MKKCSVSFEFTIDFRVLVPDHLDEADVDRIARKLASDRWAMRDWMDGDDWFVHVSKVIEAKREDLSGPDVFAVCDDGDLFVSPEDADWIPKPLTYEPPAPTEPDDRQGRLL
jgi:hypothetical protein